MLFSKIFFTNITRTFDVDFVAIENQTDDSNAIVLAICFTIIKSKINSFQFCVFLKTNGNSVSKIKRESVRCVKLLSECKQ